MANVPTPRSYPQILGDMIDAFQSRFGIDNLRVGSPILSIMEAAAQSDLRSSQDIFAMLNSISLDRAEGDALDRIGADEDLPRRAETFASGLVNIGDASFTKLSTKVYVGQPAPIIGSATIFVADASSLPSSGTVYVGRGTTNFEGPLSYTATTNLGTYWSLTLAGGSETQKFHNHNESVVLGQGGNRVVSAGTVVQTQQGNVAEAIQFSTLYAVTVPDGEVLVTGVAVVAKRPGIDGNAPLNAIREFPSNPFTGATVTNPLPYSNALAAEDDRSYRERIRAARQSRSKGTPLSIETGVLGVSASDENKSVLSASVVTRQGFPTTLYIDDGTGYEEKTTGVAIESIVASATGGEQYFEVNNRPVAKAFVETTIEEPFILEAGSKLAVKVNGITYEHTFSDEEFRNISNATSFEVVASINGDDALPFDARLSSNGKKVGIIADADTQEDLEVVAVVAPDIDANAALGFTAGRVDTMLLYQNDRLLNKDGRLAILTSRSQALWAPSLTTPATLIVDVDNTGGVTYSFTAQDFIDADTGYVTLSATNSLQSWADVFNSRIAGVSAEVSGTAIVLVSNLGPDNRALVRISGGTLVTDGMFSVEDAVGVGLDYTLDRNTGQIRLESSLDIGDTLALGTAATRAFVESTSIPTTTLSVIADQWWVVDGGAERISTGMAPGSIVSIADYNTTPLNTWGDRVRTTASTGSPYTNVVIGDWVVFYDAIFAANNKGAWRVAYVDPSGTYFDIERPTAGWTPQAAITLTTGGLVFIRTEARIQHVSIPAGTNYTAASLVDQLNADLRGATAEIYHTTRIRVRTNTFALDGDIALVAQNTEAEKLKMTVGDAITNLTSHLGIVVGNSFEEGTPEFIIGGVNTVTNSTTFVRTATNPGLTSGHHVVFERPLPDQDTGVNKDRYANANFHSPLEAISGTSIITRTPALQEYLPAERYYAASPFAIGPEDVFTVLVDENEQSQRYVLPMWRRIKATTATYGLTNLFTDSDNSNASLAAAFGLTYDFLDFAVWMKARTKTHNEAGDTTKTILYRYTRFGPEGNYSQLRYTYPTAANSAVAVSTDALTGDGVQIRVQLPSSAARTGVTSRASTRLGVMAAAGPGIIQTLTYIMGFDVSSAARVVKLRVKPPSAGGNFAAADAITGGTSGATATVASVNYSDLTGRGLLTLTGVAGVFIDGENLTSGGKSGLVDGSQYGVTTLTLNVAAPGATDHGFTAPSLAYTGQTVNFTIGAVVRGNTSSAIGVIIADADAGTTGVLKLRDASGAFVNGETLTDSAGGTAVVSGVLVPGDAIFLASTDINFQSGLRGLDGRTATTVQYVDVTNTAQAATPNIGTVSYDTGEAKLGGSTVVANDISSVLSGASLPAIYERSSRITVVANQYWKAVADTGGSIGTVPLWGPINAVANLSFFPINTATATATAIAAAVNALAAVADSTVPVTAVAVGDGVSSTGVISLASYDEFSAVSNKAYSLTDGINWVRSEVQPVLVTNNYQFTFKDTVTATLATNSDWANEEARLVPVTTKNVVDWLNTQGVSGLSSAAENARAEGGDRPQISTLLPGSSGGVRVQGGTANSVSAAVVGAATNIAGAYSSIVVRKSDATGLRGGQWVDLQNSNVMPKQVFASGTVVSSVATNGTVILDATSTTLFWDYANVAAAPVNGFTWQIEKQGRYVAFVWQGIGATPVLTGVSEGDWVTISGGTANSRNYGNYRIVRISNAQHAFWIENDNALEQRASADLLFRTYDSVMPGDTLIVGSSILGAANVGTRTVLSLGDQYTIVVDITTAPMVVFTGPLALGTASPLFQVFEGEATKLVKKIRTISPNSNGIYVDIKFETAEGYRQVSSVAGTLVQSLDKLDFSTDLFAGVDGYRYSTGLIHEVNRVAYGDPADPAAYPGIIAAGAQVNIQGPLIKRVTCSLALRLKSGVSSADIMNRVRSAVASIINSAGVGEAIAISDIVTAAGGVNGVVAVTVLEPTFTAGNDLISVQPFEKPLVLDPTQDISVSLVSD